ELESALLAADVGIAAATALMDAVRDWVRQSGEADADSVRTVLKKAMIERLRTDGKTAPALNSPHVILLAGVNGVGKTATAGKLAGLYGRQGKRVVLVAADTFRAGAGKQLALWGRRVGAEVGRQPAGADPAAAVCDGVGAAVGVTGLILPKLDGTAKGGIVLAVAGELRLPLRYIGVGEGVEDLQAFEPEAFVDALLGES